MTNDYTSELANAIALVTFGRGSWVESAGGKYVVARYTKECNETIRPAGAYWRTVLGEGATRREAIENTQKRHPAHPEALTEVAAATGALTEQHAACCP
jgi:hypothetical protein